VPEPLEIEAPLVKIRVHSHAGFHALEGIEVKGAWTGPAALSLMPHALASVAELPSWSGCGSAHRADLTLGERGDGKGKKWTGRKNVRRRDPPLRESRAFGQERTAT